MINITKGIQDYIFNIYNKRIELLNEFLETNEKEVERKYYDCSIKIDVIESINMQCLNSIANGQVTDEPYEFICNHLIGCILKTERDIAISKEYSQTDKIPVKEIEEYRYHLKVKVTAIKETLKSLGFKPNIQVETIVVKEDEVNNSYTN